MVFDNFLQSCSSKSVLSKHWIVNLMRPVMFMLVYIRAEREGDLVLHLYACHNMMPYFFAAGHTNYARYGLCYLRTMYKLPGIILDAFMIVCRMVCGMICLIETAYIKYGKGPGRIIRVTKSRDQYKYGQNVSRHVQKSLRILTNSEKSIQKLFTRKSQKQEYVLT